MKTIKFQNRIEWLLARRERITGSKLKNIVVSRGTKEKIGFYELIADRLLTPSARQCTDLSSDMDRGNLLEEHALKLFQERTDKTVNSDLVLWVRDDNQNIALSPDGIISTTEAVEVKCLSAARHVETMLNDGIPADHKYQTLQYFIVNDELQTLNVVFYDPRIIAPHNLFVKTIKREDVQADIEKYRTYQTDKLQKVDTIVAQLLG